MATYDIIPQHPAQLLAVTEIESHGSTSIASLFLNVTMPTHEAIELRRRLTAGESVTLAVVTEPDA